MASTESRVEKIQKNFRILSETAFSLNAASDELTKAVSVLDDTLKRLNVGLTAWVTFRSWGDEDSPSAFDQEEIGYCKVSNTWGLALRRVWGDQRDNSYHVEGPWLFNDASREMRLQGVDKIPDLVEKLSKTASETTKKIEQKTKEVRDLAAAVTETKFEKIRSAVKAKQKFLGEILDHATHWGLNGNELILYFPDGKRPFAEMAQGRDSLAQISRAAQEVLGHPVQVSIHTQSEPASEVQK